MKAVILLGTLKKEGLSNTEVLSEFLADTFKRQDIKCNFYNAVGVLLPPFATLSVLWEKQKNGADTSRGELWEKYKQDYTETTDKMVAQMVKYVIQG